MISVLVYGRNDAHGYNLHKRAAVSLNCIAQLLSAPGDEILFVDYNTPDDLPTFPEAIGDTLTEAARERLKVIRVRPAHHAHVADKTHLVAIEPIARNVALRRSNPANRWVLSTNTDMIFVPRDRGDDLTTIFSALEDGFYHLPRFELPESLWESFDRGDPDQAIARTLRWADRFHLNEVVHAAKAIVYDGPGDFQLALRNDLFGIDGFDERMLLGWHLDSNLARRMRLRRGEIGSLAERLAGYHCDHTRQATLAHHRGYIQNDWGVFVEEVREAGLPEQTVSWGLAGAELETFRLGQGSGARYFQALDRVLDPADGTIYEGHYSPEGFNDLRYTPEHALPYVLDLLSSQPPTTRIGYAGSRGDMLRLIAKGVEALLPRAQLTLLEDMAWLAEAAPGLPTAPWAEWSADAELYIFELGEPDPEQESLEAESRAARNAAVVSAFWRFGQEQGPERRPRVLAINAVNNSFEPVVNAVLNCTPTPYGTRVRHGVLDLAMQPRGAPGLAALGDWMAARTGRYAAPPLDEVKRLRDWAVALAQAPGSEGVAWWKARLHAGSVLALMKHPDFPALAGAAPEQVERARSRLSAGRPSNPVRAVLGELPAAAGPSQALNRPANADDWEDPEFLNHAVRHFGGLAAYDLAQRSIHVWGRVALLTAIEPLLTRAVEAGRDRARVLLVADGGEPLAPVLESLGARVDTTSPAALLAEDTPLGEPGPQHVGYDVVAATHNALMSGGAERFAALVERLDARVRWGGLLAFTTLVRLDGGVDTVSVPRALFDGGLADAFARTTGYEPVGGGERSLSPTTLDRTSKLGLERDIFVHDLGDGYQTLAMWAWTKARDRDVDAAALALAFEEVVGDPQDLLIAHGFLRLRPDERIDVTERMLAQPDVGRAGQAAQGWRVEPGTTLQNAVFGPYLRLSPGRYRAEYVIVGLDHSRDDLPVLALDAALDNATALNAMTYMAADVATGRACLDFEIRSEGARGRLEVRLSHFGAAAFEIESVGLERLA